MERPPVRGAVPSLPVDRLGGGHDDLAHREPVLDDELVEEGRSDGVHAIG
jgi:hypothetical protein